MTDGDKLPRFTKFTYSLFRLPMSGIDFTLRTGARQDLWINTIGMTLGTQAMLVAVCKSVDFLLGFIVGRASDNVQTRWGRRLPFIFVFFPLGLVCFLLFCNASDIAFPSRFSNTSGMARAWYAPPCKDLVEGTASVGTVGGNASCPMLAACLADAISASLIDAPDRTFTNEPAVPSQASMSVYFVVTYFLFFLFTWTCTQAIRRTWRIRPSIHIPSHLTSSNAVPCPCPPPCPSPSRADPVRCTWDGTL